MSSSVNTEYCSFTKAVEYLGDRWSLLIMRELAMGGPLGFNAIASAVPGHISRSVLTERLRKLRDLGLVTRQDGGTRQSAYQLAEAGESLVPTLLSLRDWAEGWLPDDPAMVARDPEIILGWLTERVDVDELPEQQVIVELTMRHEREHRSWLVLEDGEEPYGCLEDPQLDESRYVYVEAGAAVLMAVARGRREWTEALADGSIASYGDPELVAALPTWFRSPRPAEVDVAAA